MTAKSKFGLPDAPASLAQTTPRLTHAQVLAQVERDWPWLSPAKQMSVAQQKYYNPKITDQELIEFVTWLNTSWRHGGSKPSKRRGCKQVK